MRKLFLLPALMLSIAINAKEINITPTSPHSSGNNLLATLSDAGTEDGDVIILADGTYNESSNYISFDKSVEVRAAEGAHPVVEVETYIKIGEKAANKNITIRGIKFDAEKQGPTGNNANSYSHFIRVYSAGTLYFENCEFYNTQANKVIKVEAGKHLSYLKINSCYFHDGNNSAIHVYQATDAHACDKIEIINSTFANYSGFSDGLVEVFTKGGELAADPADDAEFTMDHCTFYNYIKSANNTYGFVDVRKSTKTTISNCIFMNPTIPDGSYNAYATYTYGGSVTNCIYNGTRGNRMSPTGSSDANPLFTDAANGDFSFAGDYETMTISPARGAATDGSDLGAPRWYTDPVLPSTDFATPYSFVGEKAIVGNNMELDANNYIHSKSSGGSALWKIHAERVCDVQVTLNMDPDGNVVGHNYQVEIFDADGNSIGSLDEGRWSNNVDDKVLSGKIHFPAIGDYSIELSNGTNGTTSTIKGITLTFAGGEVFDLPATLLPIDATISQYAEINGDGELVFSTKDWLVLDQFGKWNIHVEKGGNYAFQLNAKSTNSHSYKVSILTADESETLQYFEKVGSYGVDLSATEVLTLTPGDYVVMVQNTTNYSAGRLVNIIISYEGGGTVTLPDALEADDAIFSTKAYADGGEIYFSPNPGSQNVYGEWAKWNIKVETAGTFLFTMNVTSTNSQTYKISILDGESEIDSFEKHPSSGDQTLKHYFNLAAGNYTVKVENTYSWSNGHVVSLVVTEPALLVLNEAATENSIIHNNYRNGTHDIQIIRSIVPDMYNTICLPFDVNSSELQAIFGSDVELLQMANTVLNGSELDLNFDVVTSIYRGTPYLIKTSKTVTNPVFAEVEIKEETGQATATENVDFIGSFIKSEVPAGEDNLFLGPNNLLYFSDTATPIKGMRAWFRVKVPDPQHVIRHARIVKGGQVLTDIELVNGEPQTDGKFIENGQLIIVRDGVRYNALGIRVK